MQLEKFSNLSNQDKVLMISKIGKLQSQFTIDEFRFSPYRVEDYFVEVRSKMKESVDPFILEMRHEELPMDCRRQLRKLKKTNSQLALVN